MNKKGELKQTIKELLDEKRIYPSIASLTRDSGASCSCTVGSCLVELEKEGYLKMEKLSNRVVIIKCHK